MNIFPAIDIINGEVVRLRQGDYSEVKKYAMTPEQAAMSFSDKGAEYIHIVDLDGAKAPENSNFKAISSLIGKTGLFTEVGGGIRSMERIEKYLECGAGRVILGTAALNDEAFLRLALKEYGNKICVGVDAKNGMVATDGWIKTSDKDSFEFCTKLRELGVETVIYTDIAKDGMLSGTNLEAYARLAEIKGLKITASGGITTLAEIKALKSMGTENAIIGKAMYEGLLRLEDAIMAAK